MQQHYKKEYVRMHLKLKMHYKQIKNYLISHLCPSYHFFLWYSPLIAKFTSSLLYGGIHLKMYTLCTRQ